VSGDPAQRREVTSLRPVLGQGCAPTDELTVASDSRTARARSARLAWIFGYGIPLESCHLAHVDRIGWTVEIISTEDRFWDACPCAPLVVGYVTDLLGVEATRWEFAKAIVRSGHVSTLFVGPGGSRDPVELWVSATHQGADGWKLRHSELPARFRA